MTLGPKSGQAQDQERKDKSLPVQIMLRALNTFSIDSSDDDDSYLSENAMEHEKVSKMSRKEKHAYRAEKLAAKLNHLQDEIDNTSCELNFRKSAGQEAAQAHRDAVGRYEEKMQRLKFAIDRAFEPETMNRRSSLGSYVMTMRGVAGPGSMYVQQIQGQACRAFHMAEVQKNQRDIMNRQALELCVLMKQQVVDIENEKAEMTKNMLTKEFETGCDSRDISKKYRKIIKGQKAYIKKLEDHLFHASLKRGTTLLNDLDPIPTSQRTVRHSSISHMDGWCEASFYEARKRLDSSSSSILGEMDEQDINRLIEQVSEPKERPKRRASMGFMTLSFNFN